VTWLIPFVTESNRIEGIEGHRLAEVHAHARMLNEPVLRIEHLEHFVQVVAKAALRDRPGMNVTVGGHMPPSGGPELRGRLLSLLWSACEGQQLRSPFRVHREYETLHPFMDGNGRSGRLLWLWMMEKRADGRMELSTRPWRRLGFLHWWYYQSLEDPR